MIIYSTFYSTHSVIRMKVAMTSYEIIKNRIVSKLKREPAECDYFASCLLMLSSRYFCDLIFRIIA